MHFRLPERGSKISAILAKRTQFYAEESIEIGVLYAVARRLRCQEEAGDSRGTAFRDLGENRAMRALNACASESSNSPDWLW